MITGDVSGIPPAATSVLTSLSPPLTAGQAGRGETVSWVSLAFGIGKLIGVWAIPGYLPTCAGPLDVIKPDSGHFLTGRQRSARE